MLSLGPLPGKRRRIFKESVLAKHSEAPGYPEGELGTGRGHGTSAHFGLRPSPPLGAPAPPRTSPEEGVRGPRIPKGRWLGFPLKDAEPVPGKKEEGRRDGCSPLCWGGGPWQQWEGL